MNNMSMNIGRRPLVRIITYISALVLVLGVGWISASCKVSQASMAAESNYQRAMLGLSDDIGSIDLTLEKAMYAGSDKQFSTLAGELWSECASAKTGLGQLPVQSGELDNVNRFLSQVGEFALSLADKRDLDEDITEQEQKQLESLREYASRLRSAVDEMMAHYSESGSWLEDVQNDIEREAKNVVSATDVRGGYSLIAEEFDDYPKINYDGPFSDHIFDKRPQALEGKNKIDVDKALEVARRAAGTAGVSLMHTGSSNGSIPCYIFNTDQMEINVTVQGGFIRYMLNSREVSSSKLSVEKAIDRAEDYLDEIGYDDMESNYYIITDDRCIINFVYEEDDVTVYPDLIKVGVALDNGEVVSIDASDYLMNHTERSISRNIRSSAAAAKIVSKNLKIKNSSLAIIPTDSKSEKLCWEFVCQSENSRTVLVYINAENLVEEEILLLVENETGRLTM